VIVALFVFEAVYFAWALRHRCALTPSDMIVVFNGSTPRVKAGYDLALKGLAPYLVISPASQKKLEQYDLKYARGKILRHIVEPNARSTFENALFSRKIIEKEHFHSVILVASFEHFPRSFFLLRTLLLGKDVKVLWFKVGSRCGGNNEVRGSAKCLERYFNEMVRFWGSVAEMVIYVIPGRLPVHNFKDYLFIKFLRSHLLFNVGWD